MYERNFDLQEIDLRVNIHGVTLHKDRKIVIVWILVVKLISHY